jgi:hypothetical protein
MQPSYLEQLADMVDPDQLWRLPLLDTLALPEDQRQRLDAGVALRRYASHQRDLRHAFTGRCSVLITPLSENGTATAMIRTPYQHRRLRDREDLRAVGMWARLVRWWKQDRPYISHRP